MPKFNDVNPRVDFVAQELDILEFWDKNQIFQKSTKQREKAKRYVFFEGPPTANARPGIHHVESRAFKDLWPRFKTMQGYLVERKAGWDTHGLPVELAIEKKLGLSNKSDIEKYGIAKFNAEAQKSVWEFKEIWDQSTKRLGFWLDLDNPYITYDPKYIESLWWIIKQIWDKDLLYFGYKIVPQCPRCGTALSSHEVAQGYQEVEENSIYFKCKVKGQDNTYILVWTTTPWTLPGNVALAVSSDPAIYYFKGTVEAIDGESKVNLKVGDTVIFAREAGRNIFGSQGGVLPNDDTRWSQQVEEDGKKIGHILFKDVDQLVAGEKLVGVEYEPLFPGAIPSRHAEFISASEKEILNPVLRSSSYGGLTQVQDDGGKGQDDGKRKPWSVYPADFVTISEGTGVVHIAPMYGEDDYNLGKKMDLPMVHTVSEEGLFLPSVTKWVGKFVKDPNVEKEIVADLKERGLLFKEMSYKHDYPFCWRCGTPLLYYAKNSWMIAMTKLKKKLIAENNQINWVPRHIRKGRFGEWLENLNDWAFSRERYWGTPLPLWKSADGNYICVGSFAELRELAKDNPTQPPLGKGGVDWDNFDPHRPFVDGIVLEKDGKEYRRVPEVIDVWFDSGAMPFAQWHYPFENKERIDKNISYPADFISEAQDQTRGWFYTLLAVSVLLGYPAAYKNVLVLGMVLDKTGKKMSKSKGNVINPEEIFKKYGADVARWYFYSVNQPCDSKLFDEDMFSQIIRRFVLTLWNTYSFFVTYAKLDNFDPASAPKKSKNVLDQWIIAKLNKLVEIVTDSLEKYDPLRAALEIEAFVGELSNWYVRRSRKRFWRTVRHSHSEGGKSAPLDSGDIDKQQAYQTLHQVLRTLNLVLAPFMPFVTEAIYQNLKNDDERESVHLCDWPKTEKVDVKILEEMKRTREIVELGHHLREEAKVKVRQPLQELKVKQAELPKELAAIALDELNVKKITFGADEDELVTEITPELEIEGMARELVRAIQALRKNSGLDVADRIILQYSTGDELVQKTFASWEDYIKGEVLATEIKVGAAESAENIKVNGRSVQLSLARK
ncbi:MAG: class I tRNA ligase family protein [Patescibacteria group bacterium]